MLSQAIRGWVTERPAIDKLLNDLAERCEDAHSLQSGGGLSSKSSNLNAAGTGCAKVDTLE